MESKIAAKLEMAGRQQGKSRFTAMFRDAALARGKKVAVASMNEAGEVSVCTIYPFRPARAMRDWR